MKPHMVVFLVTAFLVCLLAGCGDSGSSSSSVVPVPVPVPSSVSVSVSPSTVNLGATESQQFAAMVTNTSNTAVTWGVSCSGQECGTISASGLYTAPPLIPNAVAVTITATSQADSRASSTAMVNQVPLSVRLSPLLVTTMPEGASRTFTAAIDKHPNQSVTWKISGMGCAGTACGTLTNVSSAEATYTAPASFGTPATVLVTATSVADPDKSQAIKINLMPISEPLSGRYGFVFRTSNSSTVFAASLVADGNGTLNGVGDLVTAAGAQANKPFTGTYVIGGNHRGTMRITGAGTTLNLRVVMPSGNFGRLLDFSGVTDGNGWFERQNESAFSTTAMEGNHHYLLAGAKGSTFMSRVGHVALDSACTVSGSELVNDTTMDMFAGGYGWDVFSGGCTLDKVTGRGTLTATDSFLLVPPKMSFYVVDVTHALMLADLGSSSVRLSGEMQAFASSELGGDYTYYVATSTGLGAGRMTIAPGTDANSWTISGIMDEVDSASGVMLDMPVSGNISPDGTTTMNMGDKSLVEPSVHVISPGKLILSGNGFYGEGYLQEAGPFSSTLSGDFGLQLFGQDVHAIGMAHIMPPNLTGRIDLSNDGLTVDAAIAGTISFLSGDRANVSLSTDATGTLPFRAYVISPNKLLLVSTLPGQVTIGWADKIQ